MKKVTIALVMLLSLAGCGTVTGVTVNKSDLHALVEKDNKKCVIQFRNNDGRHKDIKTNFTCDQVKYFDTK